MLDHLREVEKQRWLPLNLDLENACFDDVSRILNVLDDYALKKLAKLEKEPLLPQVIRIQRAIRSFLVRTRLHRCVRDGIKFIRGMRAMARFEERSTQQQIFYRYELQHEEAIKESKTKAVKQHIR